MIAMVKKAESALVGAYKAIGGLIAGICALAAVLTLLASGGGAIPIAGTLVVGGFLGWLSLYTTARVLRLLEEIRDAGERTAAAAEDKE